jgi:hypothetical protein
MWGKIDSRHGRRYDLEYEPTSRTRPDLLEKTIRTAILDREPNGENINWH